MLSKFVSTIQDGANTISV